MRALPAPDPETEVPDDGSSTASPAGSSSGGFFEDAGPEFDPKQRATPEDEERRAFTARPSETTGLPEIEWDPQVVRSILEALGGAAHMAVGQGEEDWAFVELELRALSKPLARILSRYDATAGLAAQGDEIAVVLAMVGYTMRSLKERRAALAAASPAVAEPEVGTRERPFTGDGTPDMEDPLE